MTGTQDQQEPQDPSGQGREDDGLTQHGADQVSEEWDVAATDPRPTGAGAGETPEAAAEGTGGRDGNLAGPSRFHGEEDVATEDG
ncbi:hypothetical protein [Ornithinimicrobium cavernae]|uniref:hypothetical protein n=1 Tax=Ornithinimicrobium cavernae TaxID=2666047 RepID=UPI000D69A7D2|nr:hypothetical protein [Ornithinimicrobium cavernae]